MTPPTTLPPKYYGENSGGYGDNDYVPENDDGDDDDKGGSGSGGGGSGGSGDPDSSDSSSSDSDSDSTASARELYRDDLPGGLLLLERLQLQRIETYQQFYRKVATSLDPPYCQPLDFLLGICPDEEVWLKEQIEEFWNSEQEYTPNTYIDAGDNFLDLMEEVAHLDCSSVILDNTKFAKYHPKLHVLREMPEKMCGYALSHFSWGQDVTKTTKFRLEQYTSEPDEILTVKEDDAITLIHKKVYVMFQLPCLSRVMKWYNRKNRLHHKDVLAVCPGSWRKTISKRLQTYGPWSQTYVQQKIKQKLQRKEMVRGVYWPYARMLVHMWDEVELEDAKFITKPELRFVNRSLRPPFTKKHVLTTHTLNNRPPPAP